MSGARNSVADTLDRVAARTRRILVAPGTWADAAILSRDELPIGYRFEGPAIVEEPDSTTYLPPGFVGEVHPTACLVLTPSITTEEAA